MAVEAVRNGDGSTKNDCERCAWTRLVPVLASLYRRMKRIVIADGLFSRGPQIRLLQEHGLRFLLSARAGDHPHLQAQLDRSDAPGLRIPRPRGRSETAGLQVVSDVELNAANPDLKVQVLQSSERQGFRRGCAAGVHLGHGSVGPTRPRQRASPRGSQSLEDRERDIQHAEERPIPGTQLRTRNPAPVGYFRGTDAAGVPDRLVVRFRNTVTLGSHRLFHKST